MHSLFSDLCQRWHKSLKSECIRPGTPQSLEDARRLVEGYVERGNNVHLNSATAASPRRTRLVGRRREDPAMGDRKLEAARLQRQSHASKPREGQKRPATVMSDSQGKLF